MEGLIPLVYRAIKRKKTRRCYKCLSSGAALFDYSEFNANGHMFMTPPPENHKHTSSGTTAAFEMTEFNTHVHRSMTPPPEKLGGFTEGYSRHWRHISVQEFPRESLSPEKRIEPPRLRKDFGVRSHRVFACIAGG
ncbi:uncharacterized protein LOC103715326 [Phoenix dactylifera]|uniref:Uncharacterized protein LOC103715326 n=1 Tax=Phoenix dactylifera TaxID=42345 RepID=A0A8B7CKL7_PHODC|nr:uncharacterized protein LOC103715326 [Phoenix dactylifera]